MRRTVSLAFLFICTVAAQTPLADPDVRSYRIRLGVDDVRETKWDGAVTVSSGELLGVRNWHPRPEDQLVGRNEWRLSSVAMEHYRYRPWQIAPNQGLRPYIWPRGIIVDAKVQPGTRINLRTEQGRISFNINEIAVTRPKSFLNGAVVVDQVAPAEKLTTPDLEDDFATILGGAGDELWAAWVAYSAEDDANQVLARRFNGAAWEPVQQVTEGDGDIFLVKMARDIRGRPWAIWSNQVDRNFDLYARPYNDGRWGAVERLTESPTPDVFHQTATDAKGNLWVVWMGWVNGQSDIFARRYDGDSWSAPERVSTSPVDDWDAAIATDSKGGVTVAWDTYDKGNYDVLMRTWRDGEWTDAEAVADTPLYEAHASLVYDEQDRLWAAWNESGMNWGKDTGFTLNLQATRLYEWRLLRLAVYDGTWKVPAEDVNTAFEDDYEPRYDDFPRLTLDGEGRVWLFARRRIQRRRDTPSITPLHRAAWEIWGSTLDGGRWTEPVWLPFSQSRQDVRWGLARSGKGELFAAWPTDNRDFSAFLYQTADVYAAKLPVLGRETAAPRLIPRPKPALTYFDLAPTEPEDLERIGSYEVRSGGKTYKIYRGDTHRHSEISMDGNNDGSLFQTYRYALDAARLDYLLTSEHNTNNGPDKPYINWLLQQTVDVFSVPGRFQAFYGYERSISYPDGHRNVLFAERGNPTLPITPEERQHTAGAERLYAYLKERNGIAISHTSATGMGTDWRDNDPEVEPLVEIFQGDRVSAEYEGAPLAANRENPSSQIGGFQPAGYVWNAWEKGYKLGVQAASDHLSTHISYACTIAEDFTRESMLDAMKKRHSYGATDNIILDYRLQTDDGEEYLQGDEVATSGGFKLWVKVIGTTGIRSIDIIKNQEFLHYRANLPQETELTFVDNQKGPGEDYYYVRVVQNNNAVAWSSPIWVTKR